MKKKKQHLEKVDFNNMDPREIVNLLRSYKKPELRTLIKLVIRGLHFDSAIYGARAALSFSDKLVESDFKVYLEDLKPDPKYVS